MFYTWTLVPSGKVISSALLLYLDPGTIREGDILGTLAGDSLVGAVGEGDLHGAVGVANLKK